MLTIFVALVGCGDDNGQGETKKELVFESKIEADTASAINLSCERTEVVPVSRGRGHGVKSETITYYYPAYLRGDVNNDGTITREDALMATKQLFKAEGIECPAVADVGGYPQTLTPDGFFTSQDIYLFNQYKTTGVILWPQDVICGYDCEIPNHMTP